MCLRQRTVLWLLRPWVCLHCECWYFWSWRIFFQSSLTPWIHDFSCGTSFIFHWKFRAFILVIILDTRQSAFISIDEFKLVSTPSLISNIDDPYICMCECVITWSVLWWSVSYPSLFPPHTWIINTCLQNKLAVNPLNLAVAFFLWCDTEKWHHCFWSYD